MCQAPATWLHEILSALIYPAMTLHVNKILTMREISRTCHEGSADIFKIKITSRASWQTSRHTSRLPWDCKITTKKGGWEWEVKVYSVREMFNPTMTSLLQSKGLNLFGSAVKKSKDVRKQITEKTEKLQPFLLFLSKLIYDKWICSK